ncbi:MAG: hypothetical protein KJ775_15175 [Alphaproteobacteria bacterium]|nr:hypothetical protein [Alphaproteobacteria bacterium]MBU1513145.1 hypothetical protein [Alphaproteobacteria bacterium]MBU2095253.1 hypothetical protein [Alphaproteobacteria bacterium]MBU2306785.1 hypothetical protein [Alphaproteobacteria bacterium]
MGVFDDTTRKLANEARAKTVKAERLVGPYESYEGYDDGGLDRLRSLTRRTRLRLAAALDREALAMGAAGLAVGVAIGVALMWRRSRR